ncbi:hypothetical protein [Streptomyces canus]|uniref:hypothetical protein n=1 Tax=Streptomyces canus TaxID=58343 RepID=UPI003CF9DF34
MPGNSDIEGARHTSERLAQSAREEWLRQQRRDAYVNFYNAARVLFLLLVETAEAAAEGNWVRSEEVRQAARAMGDASGVLAMEATQRILEGADSLSSHISNLDNDMRCFDHAAPGSDLRAAGRTWRREIRSIYEESEEWLAHCREELHH